MKLKIGLGLGLACAACCAIPLLGLGGLAFGGAGLAAMLGASLEFIICVVAPVFVLGGLGWYVWNRNRASRCATCPTDGSCGCK